jgi:hypothetical protein
VAVLDEDRELGVCPRFVERRLECTELVHETAEGTDVRFMDVFLVELPHKRQTTKSKRAGAPSLA